MSDQVGNQNFGFLMTPLNFFQTHYARLRSRSASRKALKRKREASVSQTRSESRARSASRTPRDKSGVRDEKVRYCNIIFEVYLK